MRWVGHVAHMGERTGAYRVLVGRLKRGRQLRRPMHKMAFQEEGWRVWAGFMWLSTGTGGGLLYKQL